jgi:hypothetical protein
MHLTKQHDDPVSSSAMCFIAIPLEERQRANVGVQRERLEGVTEDPKGGMQFERTCGNDFKFEIRN